EQWEEFSQARIAALRKSLGQFPEPPKKLNVRVTGRLQRDGYRIENVVFESRPGLWVTANLYLPAKPTDSMPGIILSHSHHRPKEQGELQDMGMTWARAGCVVLVPDHLGHGERRQHSFVNASDYKGEFRVSRQDYYFRYDTGMQLHLIGDSLIGWLAWDLMRGVDLLLSHHGVDPKRIILLGAVAGGGDPCAVAAALDKRIACAVPFNFGGPQPETRFPLPEDSETSFNYAGSGSWESTRNISFSAQHGFLPWVIVGSIAPRRLVFAHEFNWDRPRDPVWKRLQSIYKLYGLPDNVAFTHGRGELRGRPPEATHCTNIGKFHRRLIHEAFQKWFDIKVSPDEEFQDRKSTEELLCMTADARETLKPKLLHELLRDLGESRATEARKRLAGKSLDEQRKQLRADWTRLLKLPALPDSRAVGSDVDEKLAAGVTVHRSVDRSLINAPIPMLLFEPAKNTTDVVIAIAQGGKEAFLRNRAEEIAKLLSNGVAVCLPDLRGTGEGRASSSRGQYSGDTSRSSTALMLGQPIAGSQLHQLRVLIHTLLHPRGFNYDRIALWGDSFADVNPADADFRVPRRIDGRPQQSEPLGGMMALLGALFEDDVKAVYAHGGLADFQSVLDHWQVFIPHDAVIPGVLTASDLSDVAAVLAPRPLRLEGMVDGLNRRLATAESRKRYAAALRSYGTSGAADSIIIQVEKSSPADWLIAALKNKP
ncbi:MAG: acetylxylan esterase, partial [Planctomycetes bacterium]|nr:acetylxylan esterase [Planctomycetota bacterium]